MLIMESSSLSDDEAIAVLLLIKSLKRTKMKSKRRNRTLWMKSWIAGRLECGVYHSLVQELRQDDPSAYRNFLRMDWSSFNDLLDRVGPHIQRKDTYMRQSIRPEERLALTLRWFPFAYEYFISPHATSATSYIFSIPHHTRCEGISIFCPRRRVQT